MNGPFLYFGDHYCVLHEAIEAMEEKIQSLEKQLEYSEDSKGDLRDALYSAKEKLQYLIEVSTGDY